MFLEKGLFESIVLWPIADYKTLSRVGIELVVQSDFEYDFILCYCGFAGASILGGFAGDCLGTSPGHTAEPGRGVVRLRSLLINNKRTSRTLLCGTAMCKDSQ